MTTSGASSGAKAMATSGSNYYSKPASKSAAEAYGVKTSPVQKSPSLPQSTRTNITPSATTGMTMASVKAQSTSGGGGHGRSKSSTTPTPAPTTTVSQPQSSRSNVTPTATTGMTSASVAAQSKTATQQFTSTQGRLQSDFNQPRSSPFTPPRYTEAATGKTGSGLSDFEKTPSLSGLPGTTQPRYAEAATGKTGSGLSDFEKTPSLSGLPGTEQKVTGTYIPGMGYVPTGITNIKPTDSGKQFLKVATGKTFTEKLIPKATPTLPISSPKFVTPTATTGMTEKGVAAQTKKPLFAQTETEKDYEARMARLATQRGIEKATERLKEKVPDIQKQYQEEVDRYNQDNLNRLNQNTETRLAAIPGVTFTGHISDNTLKVSAVDAESEKKARFELKNYNSNIKYVNYLGKNYTERMSKEAGIALQPYANLYVKEEVSKELGKEVATYVSDSRASQFMKTIISSPMTKEQIEKKAAETDFAGLKNVRDFFYKQSEKGVPTSIEPGIPLFSSYLKGRAEKETYVPMAPTMLSQVGDVLNPKAVQETLAGVKYNLRERPERFFTAAGVGGVWELGTLATRGVSLINPVAGGIASAVWTTAGIAMGTQYVLGTEAEMAKAKAGEAGASERAKITSGVLVDVGGFTAGSMTAKGTIHLIGKGYKETSKTLIVAPDMVTKGKISTLEKEKEYQISMEKEKLTGGKATVEVTRDLGKFYGTTLFTRSFMGLKLKDATEFKFINPETGEAVAIKEQPSLIGQYATFADIPGGSGGKTKIELVNVKTGGTVGQPRFVETPAPLDYAAMISYGASGTSTLAQLFDLGTKKSYFDIGMGGKTYTTGLTAERIPSILEMETLTKGTQKVEIFPEKVMTEQKALVFDFGRQRIGRQTMTKSVDLTAGYPVDLPFEVSPSSRVVKEVGGMPGRFEVKEKTPAQFISEFTIKEAATMTLTPLSKPKLDLLKPFRGEGPYLRFDLGGKKEVIFDMPEFKLVKTPRELAAQVPHERFGPIEQLKEEYKWITEKRISLGKYDTWTGKISVNRRLKGIGKSMTLLHEATHALDIGIVKKGEDMYKGKNNVENVDALSRMEQIRTDWQRLDKQAKIRGEKNKMATFEMQAKIIDRAYSKNVLTHNEELIARFAEYNPREILAPTTKTGELLNEMFLGGKRLTIAEARRLSPSEAKSIVTGRFDRAKLEDFHKKMEGITFGLESIEKMNPQEYLDYVTAVNEPTTNVPMSHVGPPVSSPFKPAIGEVTMAGQTLIKPGILETNRRVPVRVGLPPQEMKFKLPGKFIEKEKLDFHSEREVKVGVFGVLQPTEVKVGMLTLTSPSMSLDYGLAQEQTPAVELIQQQEQIQEQLQQQVNIPIPPIEPPQIPVTPPKVPEFPGGGLFALPGGMSSGSYARPFYPKKRRKGGAPTIYQQLAGYEVTEPTSVVKEYTGLEAIRGNVRKVQSQVQMPAPSARVQQQFKMPMQAPVMKQAMSMPTPKVSAPQIKQFTAPVAMKGFTLGKTKVGTQKAQKAFSIKGAGIKSSGFKFNLGKIGG